MTSQGSVALERAFAELGSAKMAIALLSSLLLPQWAFQALAQPLLFHPQLQHPAASAQMDPAVVPTSISAKAPHLETAVALRGSAARPLLTVKRDAKHRSARALTPAFHPTEHAEVPTSTSARDPGLAIAAARRATVVQLPVTAQPDAKLDSEPARLPTSRQMGHAEGQKVSSARTQGLVTAVVHPATVAQPLHIVLQAARRRLVHVLQLISHPMAHVAAQRSTSAKAQAMAIVAVFLVTAESLQTTVEQVVNQGLAHAPR